MADNINSTFIEGGCIYIKSLNLRIKIENLSFANSSVLNNSVLSIQENREILEIAHLHIRNTFFTLFLQTKSVYFLKLSDSSVFYNENNKQGESNHLKVI